MLESGLSAVSRFEKLRGFRFRPALCQMRFPNVLQVPFLPHAFCQASKILEIGRVPVLRYRPAEIRDGLSRRLDSRQAIRCISAIAGKEARGFLSSSHTDRPPALIGGLQLGSRPRVLGEVRGSLLETRRLSRQAFRTGSFGEFPRVLCGQWAVSSMGSGPSGLRKTEKENLDGVRWQLPE